MARGGGTAGTPVRRSDFRAATPALGESDPLLSDDHEGEEDAEGDEAGNAPALALLLLNAPARSELPTPLPLPPGGVSAPYIGLRLRRDMIAPWPPTL